MVIIISLINIFIIAFSLAMDAMTMASANSLINNKISFILKMAFTFGLFQFIMTILGFYLGNYISFLLIDYQNLFSFLVFTIIGVNIVFSNDSIIYIDNLFSLLFLGLMTSIDAFSVGLTFSFYNNCIWFYAFIIGIVTFILCLFSSLFSSFLSKLFPNFCQKVGGVLLIILGIFYLISFF